MHKLYQFYRTRLYQSFIKLTDIIRLDYFSPKNIFHFIVSPKLFHKISLRFSLNFISTFILPFNFHFTVHFLSKAWVK